MILAVVAFAVALAGPERYAPREAYQVYSAILPKDASWAQAPGRAVIARQTVVPRICGPVEESIPSSARQALDDYERQSREPWTLGYGFVLDKDYDIVPKSRIALVLSSPDGWLSFPAYFSDARVWYEFSVVGFNADLTVAVLYMAHHCGPTCGGGRSYVLQKIDGKWVEISGGQRPGCVWMS